MSTRFAPLGAGALVLAVAFPVAAQRAPAPAALVASAETVPAAVTLAEWLPAEIGQRWAIESHRIEIDWGDTPARVRERAAAGADLSGGASESWVLTVPAGDGDATRRVRIDVGIRTRVPVAARELARGTDLADTDVRWTERVVPGPPKGETADPSGLRTQRRVSTGEVLEEPAVAPGPWIESRDPVEVVFEKGRVSIALRGTALGEGLPGENVHVRLEDGRRIQGRVVAPGRVALDAGGNR
ncbi:flagellar basal body P-ring formation chaperone FlgA [Gemmatimonadota bacterium Y43]|uniref:flagellar basal body P-ring formation chaperone FlgA n=1 Tax=Gaopeijia maritima TaxID=3119007 RepID=UPI0032919CF8